LGQETWAMDIRTVDICPLAKCRIFGSNRCVFVRRRVGEGISACVVPNVKHEGGGVIVWGCFVGDTVCDLCRIQGTFNKHGYHRILQLYTVSSDLCLVPLSFVFQQDCIRWPGLHNHPTSTRLRWFGMSWTAEWRKSSQQVLSICGNSFKTLRKAFQVTTSWSWLGDCQESAKLSLKQRLATLKNLKHHIFFGYYMIPYVLFHSFDVFTVILQCRK
jgi:hypothetical protein